jgi:hypothetical protein
LNSGIAFSLLSFFRAGGADWQHYKNTVAKSHRDFSIARFWGLLEAGSKRTSTENASGVWRLTENGMAFVQRRLRVQKCVHTYNDQPFRFSGPEIDIVEALGDRFDYELLMRGVVA